MPFFEIHTLHHTRIDMFGWDPHCGLKWTFALWKKLSWYNTLVGIDMAASSPIHEGVIEPSTAPIDALHPNGYFATYERDGRIRSQDKRIARARDPASSTVCRHGPAPYAPKGTECVYYRPRNQPNLAAIGKYNKDALDARTDTRIGGFAAIPGPLAMTSRPGLSE